MDDNELALAVAKEAMNCYGRAKCDQTFAALQDLRVLDQQRIAELEKLATQRGARMQIMREWMEEMDDSLWINLWERFLGEHPNTNYQDWFDEDGVPARQEKQNV